VAVVHNGRLVATAFATSALAFAPAAESFERQWHVGADVGTATMFRDGGSTGMAVGGHLAYGLSDAFNAMLEVDASHHLALARNVYSASLGAAYTIDITRWVPYVGALVGGYRMYGSSGRDSFGVQFAAGMDYQMARNWAAGLQFRLHEILTGETSTYTTTFVRIEYLWGF
jgi:hypothetical protein